MTDVTRLLSAIEQGDRQRASGLLPLGYGDLRKPAVQQMAQEQPDRMLQSKALVHEASLRLVGNDPGRP
jgi:hypothetical protein